MARHEGRSASNERGIGLVVSVNPSGLVTVRCASERFPKERSRLVDRSGTIHGEVLRVFGPVSRPYVSVRLVRPLGAAEGARLVGSPLSLQRS